MSEIYWGDLEDTKEDIYWGDLEEEKPQYVKDTPIPNEIDPYTSSIDMQPEGTVKSEEDSGTLTQPEMQEKQTKQFESEEEEDISLTLAEISQAHMTMGDTMNLTESSEKNKAKYLKTATRVLQEKGYRVDKHNDKYVIIGQNGAEYPMEAGVLDGIVANRKEIIGSIGGGIATGGTAGMMGAGPIGAGIAGAVGGALGGITGDYTSVEEHRRKYGVEQQTSGEAKDRAMQVGLEDVIGGVIGTGISKVIGAGVSKIFGSSLQEFTSVAKLPKKQKMAIQQLAKDSDKTMDEMESIIIGYRDTIEGTLSVDDAVRGASQSTNTEQLGKLVHGAKNSPEAKSALVKEIKGRSDNFYTAIGDNEELYNMYKKSTKKYSDKWGTKDSRYATNWTGLYDDMKIAGIDESEEIMKLAKSNAEKFSDYDAKVFNTLVVPNRELSVGGVGRLGVDETARGGWKTQFMGMKFNWINKQLDKHFPGDEDKVANIIQKSLENGQVNVRKLEKVLVDEGLETNKSKKLAKQIADQDLKDFEKDAKAINASITKDNKAREVSIAKKAKIEKERVAKKVLDTKKREADYAKQADKEADRVVKSDKAVAKVKSNESKAKSDFIKRMGTLGKKKTSMRLGIKDTPSKKKLTPNQIDAQKAKEINPDDKEEIVKQLTKKSPEVKARVDAEEGLAREVYEAKEKLYTKAEAAKEVKAFKKGDIAPSSKEGKHAQTTIRTNLVKDVDNAELSLFDSRYKSGGKGWAGEATAYGRRLVRDAEKVSDAQTRQVILNRKKHFDEGLSDYYDSKDSIPTSVSDYLEGRPATEVVKKQTVMGGTDPVMVDATKIGIPTKGRTRRHIQGDVKDYKSLDGTIDVNKIKNVIDAKTSGIKQRGIRDILMRDKSYTDEEVLSIWTKNGWSMESGEFKKLRPKIKDTK